VLSRVPVVAGKACFALRCVNAYASDRRPKPQPPLAA
jgi:hypothetical protein